MKSLIVIAETASDKIEKIITFASKKGMAQIIRKLNKEFPPKEYNWNILSPYDNPFRVLGEKKGIEFCKYFNMQELIYKDIIFKPIR
jgi:hypothetical protein